VDLDVYQYTGMNLKTIKRIPMQVEILIASTTHELVASIEKYLENGWELRGELIVTAFPEYEDDQFQYTQMMIKLS
jgi:hypothetical protein